MENTTENNKYFIIIGNILYIGDESIEEFKNKKYPLYSNCVDVEYLKRDFPFVDGELYPVDKLLDLDLGNIIKTMGLRKLLFKNGLVNKKDKEYLDSIGFKSSDYNERICSFDIRQAARIALMNRNIDYLWQLLLIDVRRIRTIDGIGDKTIDDIDFIISTNYGYHLRNTQEYNQLLLTSDDDTAKAFSDIHILIKSRTLYEKQITECLHSIKEVNSEILDRINELEAKYNRKK